MLEVWDLARGECLVFSVNNNDTVQHVRLCMAILAFIARIRQIRFSHDVAGLN